MDLTARLRGKTVAALFTNGHLLIVKATDGTEVHIAWADGEGRALKGLPVCVQHGVRLHVPGLHDLIHHPATAKELRP